MSLILILTISLSFHMQVRLLKAVADDVATLVLLQPRKGLPCAVCVANTQFHTTDATPTPHLVQASDTHLFDLICAWL